MSLLHISMPLHQLDIRFRFPRQPFGNIVYLSNWRVFLPINVRANELPPRSIVSDCVKHAALLTTPLQVTPPPTKQPIRESLMSSLAALLLLPFPRFLSFHFRRLALRLYDCLRQVLNWNHIR